MTLAAFYSSAGQDALLPEARLEFIPRRGDLGFETQDAQAAARLDVVPQHGLQPLPPRISRSFAAALVGAALAFHAGLAILFALLLNWRDVEPPTERNIPVEVVARMPGEARRPRPQGPNTSADPGPASGARLDPAAAKASKPAAQPSRPPMAAPPPEPMRAATQTERNRPANITPEPPKPVQPAVTPSPVQAPEALVSTKSEATIAQAAKTTPAPIPQPKPSPAESKPTPPADLSAALPMDLPDMPTSFRAVLSGSGAQTSEEYKGLVFGRLGRSSRSVERARAQHLRGQVVVLFSVDDQGRIAELKVAASSGVPAVDALALDLVREAAPFPPPPPGTTRTFTPVLSFGDD